MIIRQSLYNLPWEDDFTQSEKDKISRIFEQLIGRNSHFPYKKKIVLILLRRN